MKQSVHGTSTGLWQRGFRYAAARFPCLVRKDISANALDGREAFAGILRSSRAHFVVQSIWLGCSLLLPAHFYRCHTEQHCSIHHRLTCTGGSILREWANCMSATLAHNGVPIHCGSLSASCPAHTWRIQIVLTATGTTWTAFTEDAYRCIASSRTTHVSSFQGPLCCSLKMCLRANLQFSDTGCLTKANARHE